MASDDRDGTGAALQSGEGPASAPASQSLASVPPLQERPASNGTPASLESTPREYLHGLRAAHRRSNGQVYTPQDLVDFVLDVVGYERDAEIGRASLLDPACGGGAFLEGAVLALARALRAAAPHSFRQRLLETIERCVFGIDVDRNACALARQTVRRAVQSAAPGPLPPSFYDANIVCADFLVSAAADTLPPLLQGGFRFIVGNPPYVPATRIAPSYKLELCRRYTASSGRLDLYSVFIERSLALLTREGRLAFITPDKFLVSQTGRALRKLIIDQAAIRMVALFRSHRIFEDAATVPCVTVLEREGAPRPIEVLRLSDRPFAIPRINVRERTFLPQAKLDSAPWHLLPREDLNFARRLQASHPRLTHVAIRVSAGPATGRDSIFTFPAGSQPGIEPELRRRAIRGRDIEAYGMADPKLEVLLPYTFDRTGESSLVDLSNFPGAAAYLHCHRRELATRHCVRVWQKRWYDLHDQIICDLARKSKILVPDVAKNNRFAVDDGAFFPLHSVYYILPRDGVDPYYLIGILNSSVATFLIRLFAPVVKDGFNRYRQQFLAELPIPFADESIQSAVAAASRAGDASKANDLVAAAFQLSDGERERIASALASMHCR